jgi:hypothetical protein
MHRSDPDPTRIRIPELLPLTLRRLNNKSKDYLSHTVMNRPPFTSRHVTHVASRDSGAGSA